jgi:hypothetical protein
MCSGVGGSASPVSERDTPCTMPEESTSSDPIERRVSSNEPGALITSVRFADTSWLHWDWTKALFIFERCLLYSGGRTGEFTSQVLSKRERGTAVRSYDDRLSANASRDIGELAFEHPGNWVVWSNDVIAWDLRSGIGASRLRLELADGTHRKVLWGRISNSLPVIRDALGRALDAHRQSRG